MKLKPAQIESFLNKPAGVVAVLFFGPDMQVSEERQQRLAAGKNMSYEDISVETFSSDPDAVLHQIRTKPLFGEQPLVRLRHITDRVNAKLKKVIESLESDDFLVIEAGDLGPRSKIRQLFEAEPNLAAIGCYARSIMDVKRMIQDKLRSKNFRCDDQALTFLSTYLHRAPHMMDTELEKLMTYMGDQNTVSLEDAKACCPEEMPASFEQVAQAVLSKNAEKLAEALGSTLETNNAIVFYRHLTREFLRLLELHHLCAEGQPLDAAMSKLRPPVFWSEKDRMKAAFQKWPEGKIGKGLQLLHQGEIDVKKAAIAPESLCRGVLQALVRL